MADDVDRFKLTLDSDVFVDDRDALAGWISDQVKNHRRTWEELFDGPNAGLIFNSENGYTLDPYRPEDALTLVATFLVDSIPGLIEESSYWNVDALPPPE